MLRFLTARAVCATLSVVSLSFVQAQEAPPRLDWVAGSAGGAAILGHNDYFGDGADRWLSGGAVLSVALPDSRFFDEPPLGAPGFVTLEAGFRSFTPEDIAARAPVPNDRPYAAYAYGSVGLAAGRQGRALGLAAIIQDHLRLEIGASGPFLGFEGAQNGIHQAMSLPKALGWDNQIGNEFYGEIRAERMWRMFGEAGGLETEAAPFVRLDLGTAENAATAGLELSVGAGLGRDLRLRETALGGTYAPVRAEGAFWRLFVGGDVKAVATDATLDGAFFRDGPSIAKETVRWRLRAGGEAGLGRATLGYGLHLLGPEFEGQGGPQLIGAVSLSVNF